MAIIEELQGDQEIDGLMMGLQNTTALNHDNVHETIMVDDTEQINGMEIQIYVQPSNPCPTTKLEDSDGSRLKSIKTNIRNTIKEKKVELKQTTPTPSPDQVINAQPVSFNLEKSNNPTETFDKLKKLSEQKQRVKANTINSVELSFSLSESDVEFVQDKLKVVDPKDRILPAKRPLFLFSLFDRLDDWYIENRQRVDGKYDPYYHHRKSKVIFRSTVEVENFILYNAYPTNPQFEKKPKEETIARIGQACSNNVAEASSSHAEPKQSKKMKLNEPTIEKTQKEIVEKFLAEAYANMQSCCKR